MDDYTQDIVIGLAYLIKINTAITKEWRIKKMSSVKGIFNNKTTREILAFSLLPFGMSTVYGIMARETEAKI